MNRDVKRLLWALRVLVAVALVGALVWRSGVLEPGALTLTSWWALALALLVLPLSLGIRALSIALLANARTRVLTAAGAMRLTLVGAGIALVLPTGPADAVKAHYGYRTEGHAEDIVVSAALDKLTSLTALCALAVVGGFAIGLYAQSAVAAVALLLSTVPVWAPRVVPWGLVLRVIAPGHTADSAVIEAVSHPPLARLMLVYGVSVLGWLATFSILYLTMRAVGADLSVGYLFAIAPVTALARMIPISAGGIGMGEVTLAVLLERAGVATHVASQAALVALAVQVLLPGAIGLLLLASSRHQRTSATSQGNDETISTSA